MKGHKRTITVDVAETTDTLQGAATAFHKGTVRAHL